MSSFAVWVVLGLVGAGFANAYFRGRHPMLNSPEERRDDLAFVMGLGLVGGPLLLLVMFFLPGFFQYGWTLSWRPVEGIRK